MSWLLTLSFDSCSPSALGSWQMTSLFLTTVCPHNFSQCIFSFQTIFNLSHPNQPLRKALTSPTCCQPCREDLDMSGYWSPWPLLADVGLIRYHFCRFHSKSYQCEMCCCIWSGSYTIITIISSNTGSLESTTDTA